MFFNEDIEATLDKRVLEYSDFLYLQDDLNKVINPNWESELTPDHFATQVVDELAELLGSGVEYKWWKHIDPDKFDEHNFKIEIIDVLFFTLSKMMVESPLFRSELYPDETNRLIHSDNKINYVNFIELLQIILNSDAYCTEDLVDYIINAADMNLEEASAYYVTKFVLNNFRQHSGYKDGTYVKVDDGVEDNERLRGLIQDFLNDSDASLLELANKTVERFYRTS